MYSSYYGCNGLNGQPTCGNNVINMAWGYYNCTNLTGTPACGNNVEDMTYTYYGCYNLKGNAYFYSPSVSSMHSCFYGRNTSNKLNIYVKSGSVTNTTIHYTNTSSLVGANITWTNSGSYQYNSYYNIYIYPVTNVAAARANNRD